MLPALSYLEALDQETNNPAHSFFNFSFIRDEYGLQKTHQPSDQITPRIFTRHGRHTADGLCLECRYCHCEDSASHFVKIM